MRLLSAEDLRRTQWLSAQTAVAVSPDGGSVAYSTYREEDAQWAGTSLPGSIAMVGEVGARLWVTDSTTGQTREVAEGLTAGAPTWSPDGALLAFFAAAGADAPVHLHCWHVDSGRLQVFASHSVQTRRMASGRPRWMSEGRRVCFPALPASVVWNGPAPPKRRRGGDASADG